LFVGRCFRIIKCWFKIIESQDHKYVNIVYKILSNDIEVFPNWKKWASLLRDILSSLGFFDVWIFQGVGNKQLFLNLVKQRLKDNFQQKWTAELRMSTRALFYREISINIDFKVYLNVVDISKHRIALSRLCTSSHHLAIETGSWHKPISIPYNDRKCIVCDKLDDEYQFVIECTLLNDLRKLYIDNYFWETPCMLKFIGLMTCEDKTVIQKLSNLFIKPFFENKVACIVSI